MSSPGFFGRVAHVDLSAGRISYETPDETWYRKHGGGACIGAYFLLRDAPANADALGPKNVFVLSGSVVAGVGIPGETKYAAVTKSPQTGGAGESQGYGPFADAFAQSGFDAVVVHGSSESPVVIHIRAEGVEIVDAFTLWGMETHDAHDACESLFGEDTHTALIGPAGEALVRFASLVSDGTFMSFRQGIGAVLGAKNVKGFVCRGGYPKSIADPNLLREVADDYSSNRSSNPVMVSQDSGWNLASWIAESEAGKAFPMPTRNFSRSSFEAVKDFTTQSLRRSFGANPGSTMMAGEPERVVVRDGPFATDPRYALLEMNGLNAVGPLTGTTDPAGVLKILEICYRFGMDPESLGGTLAWAMEASEAGLLEYDLTFDDAPGAVRLAYSIAIRSGVGDLLAEGSARAAASLGDQAARLAMSCRGREIPPFELRTNPGLALAMSAGPIGPDALLCEHDWDFAPDGFEFIIDQSRAFGLYERTPQLALDHRKVRQTVYLQRFWSGAVDSLLLDLFVIAPARYMPPRMIEAAIRAVTGWDFTILELMMMGSRRIALMQEFNRREGLGIADECLPDRFFDEPLKEGKHAGAKLDREEFRLARDLYLEMSDFDERGWPNESCLCHLELDVVRESREVNGDPFERPLTTALEAS